MYGRGNRPSGGASFGPPTVPPIVKNLMIANAVIFVIQIFAVRQGVDLVRIGGVIPAEVWGSQAFWQPFTYMWLHGGIWHIGFNMFSLWMFGSPLALAWGEQRFLRYYLVCGVGAGFVISLIPYVIGGASTLPTIGASGAVMGVLLGYSFTWPDRKIMLMFPPIPLKAIWLIPLILFMEFASDPYGTSNISHAGHLGGALVGWIYLAREGRTPGAITWDGLKHRWRRYQMRQKLRAVRDEEWRDREKKNRDADEDRRYH